jgi:uncharacterized sulfatase
LLEVANAKRDPGHVLDGQSLLPLLEGSGSLKREALFWHYPHYHHSTPAGAIRQGHWKLIEFFEDNHVELYDLDKDIGETHNCAAEEPEKAKELQQKLTAWRASVNAAMPSPNPDYDPAREKEWGQPRPAKPQKK